MSVPVVYDIATGWAAVRDGKIYVRSVSDTRRAAQVNWLVAERYVFISIQTTDEEIERIWAKYAGNDLICTTVSVQVTTR